MAEYTKVFDNPYPEGWKDLPSEETPITAAALQEHTDAIENIEAYLEENPIDEGGTDVQWNQLTSSGTHIADITIDGETTEVFAPSGGGSGSDVVELTKAEYDALPDSKLTDGKQYFIKDYSESGSGSENVYSDEEIEIGTWFGKPLYRKVVSKENLALPSYSASSIDVNLTSDIGTSNIQIIKANITVYDSASGQSASVGCQIAHTIGTNSYKVKCLDSWGGASGRYVYFILEYTKD